jgi:hypothetical protein
MNSHYIFPNFEKLKSFVETFTPYIIKEQLHMSIRTCIFDIDQAQFNSVFLQFTYVRNAPRSNMEIERIAKIKVPKWRYCRIRIQFFSLSFKIFSRKMLGFMD